MDDTLFTIRYPFADGDGSEGVSIATVRPATILADVAVAVHPGDPRYRDAIGREVVVPYVEQHVPVIADERIDREFGTGALKVTPGHDPLDFEIGRDHGLPEPMAIGWDGRMSEAAGDLAGLTQDEAGARVHRVGRGARAPREARALPALGRHVRALPLAHRAADLPAVVVRDARAGRAGDRGARRASRPLPSGVAAPLRDRLARGGAGLVHLRQLWWGHQLPIWYCPDGHATVRVEAPSRVRRVRLDRADARVRRARHVVLLGALAVRDARLARRHARARALLPGQRQLDRTRDHPPLGEPDDLDRARGARRGSVHRRDHPLDAFSPSTAGACRRASAPASTRWTPIEEYGADATRYGLLKISSTQDVRFSYGAIEEGRKLAIKLWNVARLVLQNAAGVDVAASPQSLEERWILARLDAARAELEDAWGRFDFAESTATLYHLTFDDFCDWYAEAIKPRLYDRDEAAISTALAALERLLALLHPVMPHVTEEIWTQLPTREARLIVSPWPGEDTRFAADAGALDRVQEAAQIFRRSGVEVELGSDDERRIFAAVVRPDRARVDGNRDAEVERLRKEVSRAEGMLANERFVANAPAEVVAAEREKLERYRRELAALEG